MDERFPQYLHLPLQVLWFDTTELFIMLCFYLAALLVGGIAWVGVIAGPVVLISYKRKQARGYFQHLLYSYGYSSIQGYPLPTAEEFHE